VNKNEEIEEEIKVGEVEEEQPLQEEEEVKF
jgi:hypothetical protein